MKSDTDCKNMLDEYEILYPMNRRESVFLVRKNETNQLFVQKYEDNESSFSILERLSGLKISGIPKIYDLLKTDHQMVILEEYINGADLEYKVAQEGPLSEKEVFTYSFELCRIVKQLHLLKPPMIHRDIKPANLILSKDHKLYLVDFNAARTVKADKNQDTVLLGTEHFAAPEQFGFGQSDIRTDIYCIGATINYLLTGKYASDEICKGTFGEIIKKCTMLKKEERYGDIDELMKDLSDIRLRKYGRSPKDKKTAGTSLAIPGFRSKCVWKMILSSLVYFAIFYVGFTMPLTSYGVPLTGFLLQYERLGLILLPLTAIFLGFNYRGIRNLLPWQDHPFLKWISLILAILITGIILLFSDSMLELILKK